MPRLSANQLHRICFSILKAAGAPDNEAQIVSEFLVEANLCGHDSHGILRLTPYVRNIQRKMVQPGAKIEVVTETTSMALINGNWGFGQVIGIAAMKIAIQKAKESGIGGVAVFNSNHVGRLSDFAMMALKEDMLGIVFSNAGPFGSVAPIGGKKGMLGTNPLCFAIPSRVENPIVLDMATSTVAGGKIKIYHARGELLPEGWIINAEGKPSTDPAAWMSKRASLLPFGVKGYGLALVIEAITALLTGFGFRENGKSKAGERKGVNCLLVIAVNVAAFTDVTEFKNRVDRMIREIKNTPRAEGVKEIIIPGEPEFREKEKRLKEGVEVEETTWNEISSLASELKVNLSDLLPLKEH